MEKNLEVLESDQVTLLFIELITKELIRQAGLQVTMSGFKTLVKSE